MSTDKTINKRKGFHLTYEDRIYIQSALESNMSFKEIGIALGKHPTTISKEVRKHMIIEPPRNFNNEYATNRCKHRYSCQLMNVCASLTCVRKKCKTCGKCNAYCKHFVLDLCMRKDKAPYVCNSCIKSHKWCQFEKRMYKAVIAQREYMASLHESREGINMSKTQLAQLDELISPLVLKGQPISHIYANHRDEMPCSLRTIYNYIDKQYLSVKNIDLRRKVRYKLRNVRRPSQATLQAIKLEKRYRDFIKYIEEYDPDVVEMDTVMGAQSSKACLLTLFFRKYRLMWAFVLPEKTQAAVIETFDFIEKEIGNYAFRKLFPVILTDNGTEFLRPHALEKSIKQGKRTRIFYCDPNASFQKGGIEKNHEFIRYVIPKGFPFDSYTQEDISLLMSHINSISRETLDGLCPMKIVPDLLKKATEKLDIHYIPPDNVNLTTSLLIK